ncbi:MAG: molybdenum cofactor biosynthesis protein MoaE [Rhodospirillales bacterium]
MIRVQAEDFDPGAELARLTEGRSDLGGIASFVGLVRGNAAGVPLTALLLEHYPGMTERRLAALEAEARRRWPLAAVLIVHRFGRLLPGERIVLAAVAARRRGPAFDACRFIVDVLKTDVPFWKKEETQAGAAWVAASDDDATRADRWYRREEGR